MKTETFTIIRQLSDYICHHNAHKCLQYTNCQDCKKEYLLNKMHEGKLIVKIKE